MGVEEAEIFWVVVGERVGGRKIKRSDYVTHDIPLGGVFSMAEELMRRNGILRARVYVFKKVAETEIDLKTEKSYIA